MRAPEESGHFIDTFIPKWYAGNVYAMDAAPAHSISLPFPPSETESTTYDLFISGDYEVCASNPCTDARW